MMFIWNFWIFVIEVRNFVIYVLRYKFDFKLQISMFWVLCNRFLFTYFFAVKMPLTYLSHSEVGSSPVFTLFKNIDVLWEMTTFTTY